VVIVQEKCKFLLTSYVIQPTAGTNAHRQQ